MLVSNNTQYNRVQRNMYIVHRVERLTHRSADRLYTRFRYISRLSTDVNTFGKILSRQKGKITNAGKLLYTLLVQM